MIKKTSVMPLILALRRISTKDKKSLQRTRRWFQHKRRPPERLEESKVQKSHPGYILENNTRAREKLHIVSWIRIMSGFMSKKRALMDFCFVCSSKPRIFIETIFMGRQTHQVYML